MTKKMTENTWGDVFLWMQVCGRKEAMHGNGGQPQLHFWTSWYDAHVRGDAECDHEYDYHADGDIDHADHEDDHDDNDHGDHDDHDDDLMHSPTLWSAGLHQGHVTQSFVRIAMAWSDDDHSEWCSNMRMQRLKMVLYPPNIF